jgi:hypothetical protein
MTTLLANETGPPDDTPSIACFSVVRTPGGRIGSVVGFYRRDTETALIRFAAGDCTEFPMSDIEPCRRLAARALCWIGWD